jgi:hypothetical protein
MRGSGNLNIARMPRIRDTSAHNGTYGRVSGRRQHREISNIWAKIGMGAVRPIFLPDSGGSRG